VTASNKERIIVLLTTYGEPSAPRFREQFDFSLLLLKRLTLRVAKIPRFILPLIAARRARRRVRAWKRDNYTSPLIRITQAQAAALQQRLRQRVPGVLYEVHPQYEFIHPLLPDTLAGFKNNPPNRLIIIPLYLASSGVTDAIARDDVKSFIDMNQAFQPEPKFISSLSKDNALLDLSERFIREKISENGMDAKACSDAALIMGAHGTVLQPPAGFDNGLETTQRFYDSLAKRLSPLFAFTSVGWLNHTVGGEWTKPDLETAITEVAKRGIKKVVYYPFGFLADNTETQLETALHFRKHSDLQLIHIPCLNDWPPFVDYLAGRVLVG
jgi:protoporphyrin/coproporphyrin ferrochelatase